MEFLVLNVVVRTHWALKGQRTNYALENTMGLCVCVCVILNMKASDRIVAKLAPIPCHPI